MSHEIIKNVSFNYKKKEIWITSCTNNVHPRTPKKWHCESLSEVYQSEGLEAVEREILKEFYNGNFQGNSTLFGKITRLYNKEESYEKLVEHRNNSNKYLIVTPRKEFIQKTTSRRAFLTDEKENAKKYNSLDAAILKMRFPVATLEMV